MLIVGLQSAWAAYLCTRDGITRTSCCCTGAKRDKRENIDLIPTIKAQGCCEVSIHETKQAPAARDEQRPTFAHVDVVLTIAPSAPAVSRIERVVAPSLKARPPPRLPLFLDKQAILR